MAMRTIKTPDGRQWMVWNVKPSLGAMYGSQAHLRPELSEGWLAFKCDQERRRVTPVPEGWDELPDAELVALWEVAERIPGAGGRS